MAQQEISDYIVYVGTFTQGASEGIYRLRFDTTSGRLSRESVIPAKYDPSFLAIHPNRRYLYAAGRVAGENGFVAAFALDPHTGQATLLNRQSSLGNGPCHLSLAAGGRYVLTANYNSGSVAVLPVREDGALEPATCSVQHAGASVNPERQSGPHAHSINMAPGDAFAYVADLGLDKILCYRWDPAAGRLTPGDVPATEVAKGSGPRHFCFHPNGGWAYLINELNNAVVAYAYDAGSGALRELQTIPALPARPDHDAANYGADIHMHPAGRFLYGSIRGNDSIVIYRIDQNSGGLELAGHASSRGLWPRNFALDPAGRILLAANEKSDNIVSFRVDQQTGSLTPTGHSLHIPTPVCLVMTPAV